MAKSYKLVTTLSDGTEINAGTFEVPDASGGQTIYRYVCMFITDIGAGGTLDYFSTDGNLTASDIYSKLSLMVLPCCATNGTQTGIALSNLTVTALNGDLGKISSSSYLTIQKYEI